MREHRSSGSALERALTRYGYSLAAVGLIIGFIGDHYDSSRVHLVGAGLLALGILFGGAGVLLGIARFPAEIRRSLRTAPWRLEPDEHAPSGRPWAVRLACLAGFSAVLGFVFALIIARVPPLHDLMQRIGWTPDFGTGFVLFGTAIALLGYRRMRRWGVWLLGGVVVAAPFVLSLTRSSTLAWANLAGLVLFLAIGVHHYRHMN